MRNTITQELIDEMINKAEISVETKFDKVTVVVCKLENGFCITESSGAVDPANYSEQMGRIICMDLIKSRLWELEGYALQKQLGPLSREAKYEG